MTMCMKKLGLLDCYEAKNGYVYTKTTTLRLFKCMG